MLAFNRESPPESESPERALARHTRVLSHDRSVCIYIMIRALHDSGASPDEIAAVVWRSPYFRLNAELTRIIAKAGGHNE